MPSPIVVKISDKLYGDSFPERTYSLHIYLSNNGKETLRRYRLEVFLPKFLKPAVTQVELLGDQYENRVPFTGFAIISRGEGSNVFPGQTVHLVGEPGRLSGLPETGRSLIRYTASIDQGHGEALKKFALRWKLYADNMEPQEGAITLADIESLPD